MDEPLRINQSSTVFGGPAAAAGWVMVGLPRGPLGNGSLLWKGFDIYSLPINILRKILPSEVSSVTFHY